MFARMPGRVALLAPVVVLALVLGGCSSGGDAAPTTASASPSDTAANATGDSAGTGSYPLPDCTGKDVATCSSQGFDPTVDGFGFANWGDVGSLNATSLITLFGKDQVCAKVSGGKCTLYPAAKQWAQQINESMSNGHCEGMAVLSQLIFQGYLTPADLDPAASTTFALQQSDPDVYGNIDLLWATQMLPGVQAAYNSFKSLKPTQIATELASGLQTGKGYTLGIYSPNGAHAVTPIAVTREGSKIAISIYDNNYPGTVQRVMIDPAKEKWSYAAGATNPDAPTGGWEGGAGTMDLTPMDSRLQLPSVAPFAEGSSKGSAPINIMVSTTDPEAVAGATLVIDGVSYDTSDPTVVLPEGVTARPTLGGDFSGRGWTFVLDGMTPGGFKVVPQTSGGTGAPEVTLSIDAPGNPRVTLRTQVADGGRTAMDVSSVGIVSLLTDDGADSSVNVANGLRSFDLGVPDGLDIAVLADPDTGVATVAMLDADGNVVGSYDVDPETDSGDVVEGTATYDPETGEFDVTEEAVEPEDFDADLVASFTESFNDGSTDEAVTDETTEDVPADEQDSADTSSDSGGDTGADSGGGSGGDTGADSGGDSGADSGGDTGADPGTDDAVDPGADEGTE